MSIYNALDLKAILIKLFFKGKGKDISMLENKALTLLNIGDKILIGT